jgi:hypothetical protein
MMVRGQEKNAGIVKLFIAGYRDRSISALFLSPAVKRGRRPLHQKRGIFRAISQQGNAFAATSLHNQTPRWTRHFGQPAL